MFYINETKINPIKNLYYKNKKLYSLKLAVKYIKKNSNLNGIFIKL